MNPRILLAGLPVASLFVLTGRVPPWVAIVVSFAISSAVFVLNRRNRLIGVLTAFGFAIVAVSALLGIIWSSEKAYLASSPVSDFLFVPLYAWSIVAGRPLVGGVASELVPALAARLAVNAPTFVWLSVAWAVFDIVHGLVMAFMLDRLTPREYVVWSRIVGWPASGVMLAASVFLIWRAARPLDGQPSPMRTVSPRC